MNAYNIGLLKWEDAYNRVAPRRRQALTRQKKTEGRYNATGIRASYHVQKD